MKKKEKKQKIEINITDEEVNRRLDQLGSTAMSDDLRAYIVNALLVLVELDRIVGLQKTTIARLRKIFGKKSEKQTGGAGARGGEGKLPGEKPKAPGHGRNGHKDYGDLAVEYHPVDGLQAGDPCPNNDGGTLYEYEPRYHIMISGGAPFTARKFMHQTLRCGLCGLIIEAKSWATGKPKYDVSVHSMLSILHYSGSFPMYRLEKLQKKFFIPMPRSVQWMLLNELGLILALIYDVLFSYVCNSESAVMSDDTKAKIQTHTKKLKEIKQEKERLAILGFNSKKSEERVEICTTGMRTHVDGHEIVIFITGIRNSGENIDELLKYRKSDTKLLILGDASSKNNPSDLTRVEIARCNVHARREFVDLEPQYESEVLIVKELIGNVYKNEAYIKENKLDSEERLKYHQTHSGPVMESLKDWCEKSFEEKKIEPNSSLGKAVNYVLNHWPGLTKFLQIIDCPLDTNILEGYIRTPVMNRKNWLHLKTEHGAFINDMHLSVMKTTELAGANPYNYFNALQSNEAKVRMAPEKWLPWNYQDNLQDIASDFVIESS